MTQWEKNSCFHVFTGLSRRKCYLIVLSTQNKNMSRKLNLAYKRRIFQEVGALGR